MFGSSLRATALVEHPRYPVLAGGYAVHGAERNPMGTEFRVRP